MLTIGSIIFCSRMLQNIIVIFISIDVICLCFSFRSFDGIGPSTDVIVHDVWYRCYCTYTHVVFMVHLFFNSGMENRILSQI